jgi:hypothetical protein
MRLWPENGLGAWLSAAKSLTLSSSIYIATKTSVGSRHAEADNLRPVGPEP